MAPEDKVTLKIDGKEISVRKGTNLIEAAKLAGVEIPHYCYHPNLSIAGNCRMCQVEVKGQPKLTIACNTGATDGMEVSTHFSSKSVADAQAATLEFILINHPLDCTVCDQAGHCKLQDYHFEYNARSSRFIEEKEHKVKAQSLGPTVMLDGERCIMCTRCIRFCDEVTKTSELGMLNRGDKSVISVVPGKELDNPLSGSVVDLCPVGALTHKNWRFNTRIWFTKQVESICPGCSTGCNVKAAVRDNEVVHVKARVNQSVNKEWLCDEGRYGFSRFNPKERVRFAAQKGGSIEIDAGIKILTESLKGEGVVVFVAPDLLMEEYLALKHIIDTLQNKPTVVLQYKERALSDIEKILISPDYAPNFRGAEYLGLVSGNLEANYKDALAKLQSGVWKRVIVIGDRGILASDINEKIKEVFLALKGVSILSDASHPLVQVSEIVLPGRTVLEKSGLMMNRAGMVQYIDRLLEFPEASFPEGRILNRVSELLGKKLYTSKTDRDLTREFLTKLPQFEGVTIKDIKTGIVTKASAPQTA